MENLFLSSQSLRILLSGFRTRKQKKTDLTLPHSYLYSSSRVKFKIQIIVNEFFVLMRVKKKSFNTQPINGILLMVKKDSLNPSTFLSQPLFVGNLFKIYTCLAKECLLCL